MPQGYPGARRLRLCRLGRLDEDRRRRRGHVRRALERDRDGRPLRHRPAQPDDRLAPARERARRPRRAARDHPEHVDLPGGRRVEPGDGGERCPGGRLRQRDPRVASAAREPRPEADRKRGAGRDGNRGAQVQARAPRAERDDGGRLLARGDEDAVAELRGRRRPLVDAVRERRGRLAQAGDLAAAALAAGEVLLEHPPLVLVEGVECIRAGQLMEVLVRHHMPFALIRARPRIGSVLLEGRILDVVLGRVFVRQPVDLAGVRVRVVDLHERRPLLGQRVLREDRLDRALGLAGAAVDALLRVDDEDPLELVDAVDGADVHARAVFDVDTGLGDDVRHGRLLYRRQKLLDHLRSALLERRAGEHLVEAGGVCAAQPGGVRVGRKPDERHVRIRVGDLLRLHARDVRDHELGRLDRVGGDQMVPRQERVQLAAEEEVDPNEQDRRHGRTLPSGPVDTKRR